MANFFYKLYAKKYIFFYILIEKGWATRPSGHGTQKSKRAQTWALFFSLIWLFAKKTRPIIEVRIEYSLLWPYSFCFCEVNSMGKKENEFQAELIKEIKTRFPGAMVLKTELFTTPNPAMIWAEKYRLWKEIIMNPQSPLRKRDL